MADGDRDENEITIVISDDHQIVRSGLRLLLEAEPGFRGRRRSWRRGHDRTERVAAYRPQVLILDLNMPGGGGSLPSIPRDPRGVRPTRRSSC